jgi:hypothetical protein
MQVNYNLVTDIYLCPVLEESARKDFMKYVQGLDAWRKKQMLVLYKKYIAVDPEFHMVPHWEEAVKILEEI